jgi:hypothetical protein
MSTRSQWSFREKGKQIAIIYKHSDGYPDGEHGGFALWTRFTNKIMQDAALGYYGHRFDDAEYLAARFVYFLCRWENGHENLNTSGVGIGNELHGDIEYLYEIDCDSSLVPVLRCKSVYSNRYVDQYNEGVPVIRKDKFGSINKGLGGSVVVKPKGSNTIKNKTFNSLNDVKVPVVKQNITVTKPDSKKQCSNDSHLKLRRDSKGHFIKMDDIAEFDYPHNGDMQFRVVKVDVEDNYNLTGVQCNCENTGYKRFNKNRMRNLYRYKGYIKDVV